MCQVTDKNTYKYPVDYTYNIGKVLKPVVNLLGRVILNVYSM